MATRMRNQFLSFATGLLALFPCAATAEDFVQLSAYYYGEKPLYCFRVPLERVRHLPTWTGDGQPPLSEAQAVEVGSRDVGLSTPPKRVELNHVNVNVAAFSGDVWYYLIEYVVFDSVKGDARVVAVVLLDGKSVTRTQVGCSDSF